MSAAPRPPCVLTVAGSDSGAGAGIQADLKTFADFGVYGTCAVAAVTAQNTGGVRAVHAVPAEVVAAQIDAVAEDFPVRWAKVGMLGTAENVRAVAEASRRHRLKLVVDPVLRASSGSDLLAAGALDTLREQLLPRAALATPNAREAAALTGLPVGTPEELAEAAQAVRALGPRAVVVTGGDLDSPSIHHALATPEGTWHLETPRLKSRHTHGTGCTFSAALCALLAGRSAARGREELPALIGVADRYVHRAIAAAPDLGEGRGPLGHLRFVAEMGSIIEPSNPERSPGSMTELDHEDRRWMAEALAEARAAGERGDVPVGAVLVKDGEVLARAGNRREADQDPTGHAELLAVRRAAEEAGHWRLSGSTLYVTLEPCFMCAGALVNARVARVVFAARDPKAGAVRSLARVVEDPRLNHRLQVRAGVCEEEAAEVLRQFFRARR